MRFTQIPRLNGTPGMRILGDKNELEKLKKAIEEAISAPDGESTLECEKGFILIRTEDE